MERTWHHAGGRTSQLFLGIEDLISVARRVSDGNTTRSMSQNRTYSCSSRLFLSFIVLVITNINLKDALSTISHQ